MQVACCAASTNAWYKGPCEPRHRLPTVFSTVPSPWDSPPHVLAHCLSELLVALASAQPGFGGLSGVGQPLGKDESGQEPQGGEPGSISVRFRGRAAVPMTILWNLRVGNGESPELGPSPSVHSGRRKGASFQPSDRLAGFFPWSLREMDSEEGWQNRLTLCSQRAFYSISVPSRT